MSKLSRAWCVTINNYTQDQYDGALGTECVYIILGKEVGAEGTPHLQGYIYFRTEKSLKQLKSLFPTAHLEIAKGTADDNRVYCSKDNLFEERGTIPLSNKRKGEAEQERWKVAREAATTGNVEIIPDELYIRYYRTFKEIAKDHMAKPADAEDLTGMWFCGPSGAGKSRAVRDAYPAGSVYYKMANKWWDGYQGEPTVCIDDLGLSHDKLGYHLKIWADRYSFLAETKGGATHIRPERIIITSQYEIDDIFIDEATREALHRRFEIRRFIKL